MSLLIWEKNGKIRHTCTYKSEVDHLSCVMKMYRLERAWLCFEDSVYLCVYKIGKKKAQKHPVSDLPENIKMYRLLME